MWCVLLNNKFKENPTASLRAISGGPFSGSYTQFSAKCSFTGLLSGFSEVCEGKIRSELSQTDLRWERERSHWSVSALEGVAEGGFDGPLRLIECHKQRHSWGAQAFAALTPVLRENDGGEA